MKDIFTPEFDKLAITHPTLGRPIEGQGGCYRIPLKNQKGKTVWVLVMVGIGHGWDHVSASLQHRCPTWFEIDFIKRMFFEPEEVVMQIHHMESKHINNHQYCLHLWRPQNEKIPLPPMFTD